MPATSCLWCHLVNTVHDPNRSSTRLTLQHVQTNATQSVDVGVVDFGEEANLGRRHGIVIREEELELEDAA